MHEWNTGKKPARRKLNQLLDSVVKSLKYKKRKIDNAIYIKVFSLGTLFYLTVYTDDVLNTIDNET